MLARYVISGQSETETKSSFSYGFIRIQFQINYCSSKKYVNFVHRLGAADYKAQGKTRVKKYRIIV